MSAKPVEIYQGSDWLTYRWPVAQAFDTLDRIRDLCLQMPVTAGRPGPDVGRLPYEIPDEDIADMFGYIVELCDDLTGELDTVTADLFPFLRGTTSHLWISFEMRLHLRDLRACALKEASAKTPSHAPPDTITTLATRIKALLKQVDQ
jgi:hypothetical protein